MSALNSSCGSPYGSPFGGYQSGSCVYDLSRTPPRALFFDDNVITSPQKKLKAGDDGSCVSKSDPPDAPRKRKPKPIPELRVLNSDKTGFYEIIDELGEGSFGKVNKVKLKNDTENPDSPSFALKVVPSGRASPIDLSAEGKNYGKSGCNWGVAYTTPDGTFFGFSTLATPLSKAHITAENIEELISLTSDVLMKADISVVNDGNPNNIGIIEPGTPTVIFGEDGLPCAGPPVPNRTVKAIDVGPVYEPENADPQFSAMISAEDMISEKDVIKYRKFKCDVMTAWLRNRLLAEPRNEYDIVREICESKAYGYTYAAGNRR